MKRRRLFASLFTAFGCLVSCASSTFSYIPYSPGALRPADIPYEAKEGYHRGGEIPPLKSADRELKPTYSDIYAVGSSRKVAPSVGETYLTVILVDFEDKPFSDVSSDFLAQTKAAFFGDAMGNQYVSLAEYYDKSSYHRLHVGGEVVEEVYRSPSSYAALKDKNNAAQTKAALTEIYNGAKAWYNAKGTGRELGSNDPVFFVYSAPYSGMDGGTGSRSSMMWAFAINEPAPIAWASYYMMHPRDDGKADAHTFIHEYGHLLGLKDYYDQNSYSDLAPCSPLGRMDMMDCSLGEQAGFSKYMLGWSSPYIPEGECEVTLRPSSGNDDCLLLPLTSYNGTAFDEYLLLEFYTPDYLNYADAHLRAEPDMSLMKKAGVKAYHVDARVGVFEQRGKTPVGPLSERISLNGKSLDLYCENSGYASGGYCQSSRGFLAQLLDASSNDFRLQENYIASDHQEDLAVGNKTAHLRDCLYQAGQGIDKFTANISFHKGEGLRYGFQVKEVTSTYAVIAVQTF